MRGAGPRAGGVRAGAGGLAEELGIDPSPQLQRLHALVLRQDPALDPPVDRPSPSTPPPPSPVSGQVAAGAPDALVGRAAEVDACTAAWRTALSGRPTAVAVVGEAGIGKTRLAEEVGQRASAGGAELVWGRCLDGGGSAAYAPWRQVVQALADSRGPESVARASAGRGAGALVLLPGAGGASAAVPAASPEVARTHLFEGVTAFLEVLAAERPLLLVLEDLHWADPETVQLTEHVVSRAARAPLCALLTVRDPEPGAAEATDRVLELVSRLPTGERVQLVGLSPDDVQRYAASRLEVAVDASVAQRLHARTNGNPFFIAELVRLLGEERAVAGRADVEVPRSVHAVLERRLAHLGSDLRAVLSAAAVLGRDVDVRLLAGVLGRSPLDLLEPLDAAATAGVLRSAGAAGQQQFTHALVQEVLLAATGPMRRAALHARAADVLEAQYAGDLARVAARLAHHHVAAGAVGDPERAVRACLLAASTALADTAYADAERHLTTALELVPSGGGSRSSELELEVRVRLAALASLVHGYGAADVLAQQRRAQQLVALVGTPEQRLSTLWGAMWSAIFRGDFTAADEQADEMGRVAERWQDDQLRLAHHHGKGVVHVQTGRIAAARAELELATALAADLAAGRRGGVTPVELLEHPLVSAPGWLALVLGLLGEDDAADACAEQARTAARSLGHAYSAVFLAVLEGWRHVFADRPREAVRVSDEGRETARTQGFQQLEAFCLGPHGWGLARSGGPGAVETGAAEIRAALEVFESLPGGASTGNLLFALCEALGAAGRWEEALQAGRRSLAALTERGEEPYLPAVHRALAECLRRTGAPAREAAEHEALARAVAERTGAVALLRRSATERQGVGSTLGA
ncbi:hypothetical protein FHN55_11945 [Streptomyces sp. NP160]|uniref:ATP-binding protein n=1 Tax=Streptomyces sp. NP160 TaxID=2586637 RepID=UPI00111BA4A7|nr:AAA family ATPase [Streptomyces sp. NP160]TNM66953.1 hypothetical protein FHN55_11945 [Streptomyces sp. NP160]